MAVPGPGLSDTFPTLPSPEGLSGASSEDGPNSSQWWPQGRPPRWPPIHPHFLGCHIGGQPKPYTWTTDARHSFPSVVILKIKYLAPEFCAPNPGICFDICVFKRGARACFRGTPRWGPLLFTGVLCLFTVVTAHQLYNFTVSSLSFCTFLHELSLSSSSRRQNVVQHSAVWAEEHGPQQPVPGESADVQLPLRVDGHLLRKYVHEHYRSVHVTCMHFARGMFVKIFFMHFESFPLRWWPVKVEEVSLSKEVWWVVFPGRGCCPPLQGTNDCNFLLFRGVLCIPSPLLCWPENTTHGSGVRKRGSIYKWLRVGGGVN